MPNDKTQKPEAAPDRRGGELEQVINKLNESKNVLIALSSDPSVDELSAAIGLSIYLDKVGKRATAIYSGETPNALEFLKPDDKFVDSADVLQDFVVAINKEKADHLRYKLDGEYVKVYITPYGQKITEGDLDFSYGDYNVDLVIALDVANGIDLDSALREHGRIMHDASIVNITTGKPGKFGEIEWSEPAMSSVSEILANLCYAAADEVPLGKDEATAFLTGIVAATNRFSNARTSSATMLMASKLMKSGANQQLIAKNVTPDVDNELFMESMANEAMPIPEEKEEAPEEAEVPEEVMPTDAPAPISEEIDEDLKAARESLAEVGTEVANAEAKAPIEVNSGAAGNLDDAAAAMMNASFADAPVEETLVTPPDLTANMAAPEAAPAAPAPAAPVVEAPAQPQGFDIKPEMVVEAPADLSSGIDTDKYSNMIADALADQQNNPAVAMAPVVSSQAEVPAPEMDYSAMAADAINAPAVPVMPEAPATPEMPVMPEAPAPEIPTMPEIPAAPVVEAPAVEIPAAPVMEAPAVEAPAAPVEAIQPAEPVVEPTPEPLGKQPAMQDQVYSAAANDPSAFHIPGM